MMQKTLRTGVLLAGTLVATLFSASSASAQQHAPGTHHVQSYDAAVLFNFERAQVAQTGTPSFWLKGGSFDASATVYKGLGIALNLTGGHASNVQPGVDVSKFSYMFGPRYTLSINRYTDRMTKNHPTQVFGEWLFGGAHAFDSIFPGPSGVTSSTNGFSTQLGGGLDVGVTKHFGVRALELDYLHTALPNNASDSQNDFRIGFGLSYRR